MGAPMVRRAVGGLLVFVSCFCAAGVLRAATPEGGGGAASLSAGCFTEPRADVNLSFPVAGRVAEIGAREGETVKAGQLLLRLEDGQQRLKRELARQVWENRAQLAAARIKEKNGKFQLEMAEQLHGKNRSMSLEELEKKRMEYQVSVQERGHLEHQESQEKLSFLMEEEEVKMRSLFAPLEGTVLQLVPDLGETVQANQLVARLADTRTGLLLCNLEEGAARGLATGVTVRLQLQGIDGPVTREGKVIFLSPVMDVASGLVGVKVAFANVDPPVRLGTPGRIEGAATGRQEK